MILISCSKNVDVTDEPDASGNSIQLTGLILNKDSYPMSDVVAKLSITGLADTTDSEGRYFITGDLPDKSLVKSGILEVLDTVIILQDEQQITAIEVVEWIDTLPDVKIVQRGISGELASANSDVDKIEAVLKGDGISEDNPIIAEFFYNDDVNEYSGFLYFPSTEEEQNFEVYINVYDSEGRLTGRSNTIDFNSLAGDITISTFDPLSAMPTADAGNDTTASINDNINLHGSGTDAFEGSIEKWEWSIGAETFVETSTGDTTITAPDKENNEYISILRITDNDGNTGLDTVKVEILQDAPTVSIEGNTTVAINTPITFKAQVSQEYGEIIGFRWDDGVEIGTDDSTGGEFTVTYLEEKTFSVTLEVEDDDGNISASTHTIVVTNDSPIITGLSDTIISINDVVTFTVEATDSQGIVEKYYWDFGDGSIMQFDTTDINTASHRFPTAIKQCTVKVIVQDVYGKTNSKSAIIDIIQDLPLAHAGNDTAAGRGDKILLSANGSSDVYGIIEKWEWDIGLTGIFNTTLNGDTIITLPNSFNFDGYKCALKVTDDDGGESVDTLSIIIGTFQKSLDSAGFSSRHEHSVISFMDKLWLIGGFSEAENVEDDIWSSVESNSWNREAQISGLGGRERHTMLVFEGNMWIIAGLDSTYASKGDVWYSADGINWNLSTDSPGFGARYSHSGTVFNNKMWIIGGNEAGGRRNDVWHSTDGSTWVRETHAADFSPRVEHTVLTFDNKLWVIGGYDGNLKNDVWYSNDGIEWVNATNSAPFTPRQRHTSTVMDNRIWLIGGHDGELKNDVWYSDDGINWKELHGQTFSSRRGHSAVVFLNALLLIGGNTSTQSHESTSDIWKLN